MVFGFGKPSRSYANNQTSNYHPATGYPVGQDESRARQEREERRYRAQQEEERSGGYGYDQDSSGSSSEDVARQRNRGGEVKRRATNRVKIVDHALSSSSSPDTQARPQSRQTTNQSQLDHTPFPTFRPKSSSSASVLNTNNGKPKKTKKTSVEKQFQAFSVLDLAPPAPVSTVAPGGTDGVAKKKKKKKVVVKPIGMAEQMLQQQEQARSLQQQERTRNMQQLNGHLTVREDDRARQSRGDDLGSEVGTSRSASQVSADPYGRPQSRSTERQESSHLQRPNRGSPVTFEDGSRLEPQSRSRSPSEYHMSGPRHGGQYSNESTPPMSESGRQRNSVVRSYDAASPWTPEVRPVSRMSTHTTTQRGPGNGSPVRNRPTSTMLDPQSQNQRREMQGDSEGEDDRSEVSSVANKGNNVRPIAGVSRSYRMVPRSGTGYTGEYDEEREDDSQSDGEDEGEGEYRREEDERYQREAEAEVEREGEGEYDTPDREKTAGEAMPPILSIQPPTPLKEEQEESPLALQGARLEGVQEEDARDADQAVEDEEAEDQFPSRPTFRVDRSNGSSRASSSSPQGSIGTPPPPSDPNQPAYLKWDQQSQRWIPVVGAATVQDPPVRRAESIVSSTSAYSQASAPVSTVPIYPQGARSSLPALQTSPARLARKGVTPGPSPLSRPSSPGHSRSPSLAGDSSIMLGPMISGGESSWGARRMSIEPAYQLSPNTLTLLPEVQEPDAYDVRRGGQSEYTRSRPPSRAASIRSERMTPRSEGLHRPSSSFSLAQSFRPNLNFPAGYDMNQRLSTFGPSEVGDYEDDADSRYGRGLHKPKARSMGGSSHYAGSIFEASQYGGAAQTWRRPEKLDRDVGLDAVSARGDPVPLLGADGVGEEGRGGYNAMILPTGAYKPSSDPTRTSNKLDGRVLGMPSSTMSSITLSGSSNGHVGRRLSLTGLSRPSSTTPSHLLGDLPPPVTYSAHQAPPSKIGNSQVLVQVYAVALDRFDFDMVREKTETGSGGGKWVPGRSFVGRALEVGAEVRPITKGDMVMGLVDIKKSGTLAEYIVVDRRRLARTPVASHLSLEQQACLPLLGVVAHRSCTGITRGARALIMNAHEGVGALVCQELSQLGAHVVAQVPADVESSEDDAWDNGALEVIVDDPIVMLNGQHESGFEFVLDTSGGRRIYDAARRVLRTNGLYVTLFGDDADHLASGPQVKSSLHALRRAFIKKDKKAISYIHLTPGGAELDVSGQDTRDILEEPIMGRYQPKVGMVIPFERAPDAFTELAATVAGRTKEESGAIVVRLMN